MAPAYQPHHFRPDALRPPHLGAGLTTLVDYRAYLSAYLEYQQALVVLREAFWESRQGEISVPIGFVTQSARADLPDLTGVNPNSKRVNKGTKSKKAAKPTVTNPAQLQLLKEQREFKRKARKREQNSRRKARKLQSKAELVGLQVKVQNLETKCDKAKSYADALKKPKVALNKGKSSGKSAPAPSTGKSPNRKERRRARFSALQQGVGLGPPPVRPARSQVIVSGPGPLDLPQVEVDRLARQLGVTAGSLRQNMTTAGLGLFTV